MLRNRGAAWEKMKQTDAKMKTLTSSQEWGRDIVQNRPLIICVRSVQSIIRLNEHSNSQSTLLLPREIDFKIFINYPFNSISNKFHISNIIYTVFKKS